MNRLSTDQYKECLQFLLENKDSLTRNEISAKIACPKDWVFRTYKKLGIENLVKYPVDPESFLNVDSLEKAYIYGILYSDGTTRQNVKLKCNPLDLLEVLPVFRSTGEWKIRYEPPYKQSKETMSIFTGQYLAEAINTIGYYNKSLEFPYRVLEIMPEEYHYMFFRGAFDGDGNCCTSGCSITGSYNQDWSFLTRVFERLNIDYKVDRRVYYVNDVSHSRSRARITKVEPMYKWYRFLYSYGSPKIGFSRKHNQYATTFECRKKILSGLGLEIPCQWPANYDIEILNNLRNQYLNKNG